MEGSARRVSAGKHVCKWVGSARLAGEDRAEPPARGADSDSRTVLDGVAWTDVQTVPCPQLLPFCPTCHLGRFPGAPLQSTCPVLIVTATAQ